MKCNSRIKKVLCFLLVLTMVLPFVPMTGFATSGNWGDNLTWQFSDDKTLTISGTGQMPNSAFPWQNFAGSIKTIIIDDGVTNVADHAFRSCRDLTTVTFGENVKTIGRGAFADCTSLVKLIFQGDAPAIDETAFQKSTLNIYFYTIAQYPSGNDSWFYFDFGNYGGKLSWESYKPKNGSCGEKLTWKLSPDGTLTISGKGNMYNDYYVPDSGGGYRYPGWEDYRDQIIHLVIEEGVGTIGRVSFRDCKNLKTVKLPDSLGSIYTQAFANCTSLKSITTLRPEYINISSDAFYGCKTITFTYPGNAKTGWGTHTSTYGATKINWKTYNATELEILKAPTENNYIIGDSIDLDGIQVRVTYADGTSKVLDYPDDQDEDAKLAVFSSGTSSMGRNQATVYYRGNDIYAKSIYATFPIFVHKGYIETTIPSDQYPSVFTDGYGTNGNFYSNRTVSIPGAKQITLTFSEDSYIQGTNSSFEIRDEKNKLVYQVLNRDQYANYDFANRTITVPGSKATITMSINNNKSSGYTVTSAKAYVLEHCWTGDHYHAPTCTEPGSYQNATCLICGYQESEVYIPAIGHKFENRDQAAPVCTNCGEPAILQKAVTFTDGGNGGKELTLQQIKDLYSAIDWDMVHEYETTYPITENRFPVDKISDANLENLKKQLNFYRALARLTPVEKVSFSSTAQYAVIFRTDPQIFVNDFKGDEYDYEVDMIYESFVTTPNAGIQNDTKLIDAIPACLNVPENLEHTPNRQLVLHPWLNSVGMAQFRNTNGMVFSTKRSNASNPDFDFVAWPSGVFPTEYFDKDGTWTVLLPGWDKLYPSSGYCTITLTRISDGKQWIMGNGGNDGYIDVNTSKMLLSFRPDGVDSYNGKYRVQITDLKYVDENGNTKDAAIDYTVTFQSISDTCAHTTEVRNQSAATCTTSGYTGDTYCTTCGNLVSIGKKTTPARHTYAEMAQQEATCTREGLSWGVHCSVCQEVIIAQSSTPIVPHTTVTDPAADPTCTQEGVTEGSHCKVCSEILTEQTIIPALGHAWDDSIVTQEPTEEAEGIRTYTCTRCGETKTEPIPKLEHAWDNSVVTQEPTEETEGVRTYTCTHCGETKTEPIPKLEHVHKYIPKVKIPTCTEQGYFTHTCTCGDSYVDSYADALGHAWDNGVVAKEPTEEAEGVRTYTCTRCGETKTEPIPKLEHVHKYESTITKPTCTKQGYTTHICACGNSYVDSYTKPLGHSFGEWEVTTAPTPTEKGVETRKCACGEEETRDIDAVGYQYGDVNGDGVVDSDDAALICYYDAELIDADDLLLSVGDVTGDGRVDSDDAALICYMDAELMDYSEFPCFKK